MHNTKHPRYDAFYTKIRTFHPLETKYTDYVNLLKSGLTTEQAVIKLKLSKPRPTGIENYYYLQQIWKQEHVSSIKDFLRCHNNKDAVSFMETIQKWLSYTRTKISISWSLVVLHQTWPTFVYTNLPMQKSIPSQNGIKTYLEKSSRRCCCLPIHRLYMQSSCSWNFFFGSIWTHANLLSG